MTIGVVKTKGGINLTDGNKVIVQLTRAQALSLVQVLLAAIR